MEIKRLTDRDIKEVAEIHKLVFSRQEHSLEWISCNYNAFPRVQCFVGEYNKELVGYIMWTQKSGFRKEAVIELEQIAVKPNYQGQGIGTNLIKNSLYQIKQYLSERNAKVKNIIVTTRTDNAAQRLYEKTLDARIEAVIRDLYSADEAILVARIE